MGCARAEPADASADSAAVAATPSPAAPLEPTWTLDSGAPFALELAIGNASSGYVLHTIDGAGKWTMNRKRMRERFASTPEGEVCELGEGTLSPMVIDRLARTIGDLALLELPPHIDDPSVNDGTHWVFVARQGPHRKRVDMHNRFPNEMKLFAELVQSVFRDAGRDPSVWHEGPCVRFPSEW